MTVSSVSDYVSSWGLDVCSGEVHSVFNTSFNVRLGEWLLHVGPEGTPLSCLGLLVPQEEMTVLLQMVRAGDMAVLRGGCLRIYSVAGVSELSLAHAPVRRLQVFSARPGEGTGLDIELGSVLDTFDLAERIGLPWTERSGDALAGLARYSATCQAVSLANALQSHGDARVEDRMRSAERAMRDSVAYLVGRGLGLTPSGDDVLMGFGVGLRFLHGALPLRYLDGFFEAVREAVPGKTTAVSEAYLRAMCDGYANVDYIELLHVLAGRRLEDLPSAIGRILQVGHTSGADSLLGFGAAFGYLLQ